MRYGPVNKIGLFRQLTKSIKKYSYIQNWNIFIFLTDIIPFPEMMSENNSVIFSNEMKAVF